jgi:uncharacterized delta-60 repeat protein
VTGTLNAFSTSAEDVAIDSLGRIVFTACGEPEGEGPPTPAVFAVLRLKTDGSRSPSFGEPGGAPGERRIGWGKRSPCPRSIAIDRRQRIVVAGSYSTEMLAARLLPKDGALDRSFGRDGRARIDLFPSDASLGGIAIDGRERVLLAGHIDPLDRRSSASPDRFALARLRADGRLDRRFGHRGKIAFRFGPDRALNAGANSVLIRHGFVYAAGFAAPTDGSTPPGGFAVLRYPR